MRSFNVSNFDRSRSAIISATLLSKCINGPQPISFKREKTNAAQREGRPFVRYAIAHRPHCSSPAAFLRLEGDSPLSSSLPWFHSAARARRSPNHRISLTNANRLGTGAATFGIAFSNVPPVRIREAARFTSVFLQP